MELKIDPEFESQIPPLADDEYQLLEENIVADGIIINPLIIWNGVIVDGHNRFHIAEKHPHIQYTTYEKEFSDRHAAIAWICRNQLGRRNLTTEQKKYLIGKQYESEKASYGGERGVKHDDSGQFTSSCQNDNLRSNIKTCERIAQENNISGSSVIRAEHFSKAVDIVDEVVPGTRKEILSGELKPTDKEIRAMARADPEECAEMVEELRKPKDERNLLKKISEDMLHARSSGKPSSMIYEMNDALESLIFRWEFCHSHYRQFFDDESCRGEVKQLIQKGFEFMKTYEGGIFHNDNA